MINILPIQNIDFYANQDNFLENKQNNNIYYPSNSENDDFNIIFNRELDNYDER